MRSIFYQCGFWEWAGARGMMKFRFQDVTSPTAKYLGTLHPSTTQLPVPLSFIPYAQLHPSHCPEAGGKS